MPTPTYTPLANITLGANAASVTFSSINQTYRDLIIVADAKTVATGGRNFFVRFNNDTGSNYSNVNMFGNGSTASSSASTGTGAGLSIIDANNGNNIIQIFDYSATDKHKTVLSRGNVAAIAVDARASRWANTAAITTITCLPDSNNWVSGSSFALYGIVA
jgi:hypothetical protein